MRPLKTCDVRIAIHTYNASLQAVMAEPQRYVALASPSRLSLDARSSVITPTDSFARAGEQKDFEVYSCHVSPDGKRLATAGGGKSPPTRPPSPLLLSRDALLLLRDAL